ncbi:hypothetical protein [Lacinutrix algicola]|uniref:hypothetical protein n=1 Tax=Lacinutrix algicola TaxID=342954 RepID=UPI0006E2F614|nr:hypothetical protein [Lacinutrix algicola]
MSVINSINEASNKAIDQSEEYLRKSHDFYKLKIFQQLSISVSMIFKAVAIGGVFLIGLIFLSIALAFYIGKLLGSYTMGFVVVGLIFSICAVLMYVFRGYIDEKVIQKLSKTFF